MTRTEHNKIFAIIRYRIGKKHPDWSDKKVNATTLWCLRKTYKTKMIEVIK